MDDLYGIDWNGPISLADDCDRVFVPQIECEIPDSIEREITSFVSPLSSSEDYGIDLYCSILNYISSRVQ